MRLYFQIYFSKLGKAYQSVWRGWEMQDGVAHKFPFYEKLIAYLILPFFGLWWAYLARRQYYDKFIESL